MSHKKKINYYPHIAKEASTSGKRIKRETFHSTEIPKLREWFNINRKPSIADLEKYKDILNNGPARIDKYKITVQKLQV